MQSGRSDLGGKGVPPVHSSANERARDAHATACSTVICILTLAMILTGCQTPKPQKSASGNPPMIDEPSAPVDTRKLTPAQLAVVDPCAIRLQDITGAILQFYVVNRHLPEKLEELRTVIDPGAELPVTCPVSHQPYVYTPNGLQSAGRNKRIVLNDAAASHDGNRWCVLMAPIQSGRAPYLEVVLMPEDLFRTYLLISEQ